MTETQRSNGFGHLKNTLSNVETTRAKSSAAWPRPQVLARLFSHSKNTPSVSNGRAALSFDCLWLVFEACETLITEDPRLDRSADPQRGYLYDSHEVDPTLARRQLSAFSLVCKSWTLPAQLRMLHSTKLYRASQAQSLISYLSNVRAAGNAVQSLELGRDSHERRDHSTNTISRWHTFEILRRCHRIQTLTFLQWRPEDLTSALNPRSPYLAAVSLDVLSRHDPFERLTSLRLHQYVGSFQTLVDLLTLTPALESFSFEGNLTDEPDDPDPSTLPVKSFPPPPFHLRRCSISGFESGFLRGLGWILSNSWNTLTRLDLGHLPAGPTIDEALLANLKINGALIQYLSVTLCGTDVPSIIKCCPNIRALRIDGTQSIIPPLTHTNAPNNGNTPPISPVAPPFNLHQCLAAITSPLVSLNLVFIGVLSLSSATSYYNQSSSSSAFSSSSKPRLGKSPSAREMDELAHDLVSLPTLSRLRSLSFEFHPRMTYPDAPLTQLRAITDVCSKRGVALRIPDLYDIVMGPTGAGGSGLYGAGGMGGIDRDRRSTRHGRFFSMHV